MPHPTRRRLVTGVAWAAPVAVVATAAPAYAASCPDMSGVVAQIDAIFDRHRQTIIDDVGDLSATTLRVWFNATGHLNGATHEAGIALRTVGTGVDLRGHHLLWDLAVRRVTTSVAINATVPAGTRIREAATPRSVPRPWHAGGQPTSGDRPLGGPACTGTRRSMSLSTSYGGFYTPDTHEALGASVNEADGRCGGAGGADIAYAFQQTNSMPVNSGVRLIAFHLRDGLVVGQGRLYNGIGIRPRGFLPPAFDDVMTQLVDALPEFTEQQLLSCGAEDLYQQRVETWQTSGESTMGLRFEVMGWASGYDDQPRGLSTTDFAWSDVTGNYAAADSGDGGGDPAYTATPYWNHERFYVGADGSGGSTSGFATFRQFDGIM